MFSFSCLFLLPELHHLSSSSKRVTNKIPTLIGGITTKIAVAKGHTHTYLVGTSVCSAVGLIPPPFLMPTSFLSFFPIFLIYSIFPHQTRRFLRTFHATSALYARLLSTLLQFNFFPVLMGCINFSFPSGCYRPAPLQRRGVAGL